MSGSTPRSFLGDFPVSERIRGYWDRADLELDLVAVNEEERRIRFGISKRNAERLPGAIRGLRHTGEPFVTAHGRLGTWRADFVAIAAAMTTAVATALAKDGVIAESLSGLTRDL